MRLIAAALVPLASGLAFDAIARDAQSEAAADPVPVCATGDGLQRIPVWQPIVDADGELSSEPPQKDGQIVYIRLRREGSVEQCNDEALNAFSKPNPRDGDGERIGGLSVNLRGNTQYANGACHFVGYYMNEQVMGMHQGWLETYFGAVPKKDVVMSGRFCLTDPIDP